MYRPNSGNRTTSWRSLALTELLSLLILLTLGGCDLFDSDSEDTSDPVYEQENFEDYVDHAGIAEGTVTPTPTQSGTQYTIEVPDKTWSTFDMWERVYLLDGTSVHMFYVDEYLLDDHDRRFIALLCDSQTEYSETMTGTLFWTNSEGPYATPPVYAQVTSDIRDAISDYIRTDETVPDSLELAIKSLGMNGNGAVFWANLISTRTMYEYDPEADELRGWIVQLDNEYTPLTQASVSAPTGFSASKLSAADMNNDGVADLVRVGLYAPGAPIRVFYFADDYRWHWVGEYDSL